MVTPPFYVSNGVLIERFGTEKRLLALKDNDGLRLLGYRPVQAVVR